MGVDAMAVVDPELRVIGLDGLRVADASIFPTMPSSNTHAPSILVGEIAASLVTAGYAGPALGPIPHRAMGTRPRW